MISFADPQNEALTEDAASDAEASANHRVAIVSFCPLGQPRLEHEFRNLRNLCVGVYSLMHDPRHEDPKTSPFLKSADDGGEPQEELRARGMACLALGGRGVSPEARDKE